MRGTGSLLAALALATGCDGRLPGKPPVGQQFPRPSQVMDFASLYGTNCAGCHGADGKGGASVELGSPVYLAFADDAVLRQVTAAGVPGTSMPAFAQSEGGTLTDAQVEVLVKGLRARFGKPDVLAGASPPPYAATATGDVAQGAHAFGVYCAGCHGADGRGGKKASAVVDGTYLALVSDQHLRTSVLVGRPDMGAPDFRANVPGQPMTDADVTAVVAWLVSKRLAFPGQPYPSGNMSAGEAK
jgi:cytochrome c oxidase cbb3-type subunit 3